MKSIDYRIEHDLIGDLQIPTNVYYGVHTLRALQNFPITGSPIQIYPNLIRALSFVKEACALANEKLGILDKKRSQAIVKACKEIRTGKFDQHFIVDVIQGGAGTSTNMNANEVIANRALEILGYERGDYAKLHPLDHVNLSQSTNDVYPTAAKLALRFEIDNLIYALDILHDGFAKKSKEFSKILKMGRTQLQEAVPMTLGQEFSTFNGMLAKDKQKLLQAAKALEEINLGATAIGTGINTHPEYAAEVCKILSGLTGLKLVSSDNLIEATQDTSAFVQLSSTVKAIAIKLSKICNDLRLLSSGPRAGIGEINLPAVQAGSSIMPGKVNPVIPEVVNQIAFEIIGNDLTVTMAAEAGQLQLNAFEPIIVHNLMNSLIYLRQGCITLEERCIRGITANEDKLDNTMATSVGIVTALNPHIGYANASAVAKHAVKTGKKVADVVLEMKLLPEDKLKEILRPENLTQPRSPQQ